MENFEGQRPYHTLTLAAESEAALRRQASKVRDGLLAGSAWPEAAIGGEERPFRLALWAQDAPEAVVKLEAFLAGEAPQGWVSGCAPQTPPSVAFLCTGQGAQYVGMGRELYATEPIFRQAMDACAEELRPYLHLPLLDLIYPMDPVASPIDETTYTQPALFAVEYALAQLWLAWGARPTAVLGHSVGEYVAATLAGVFSLADGLKLIAARGRLMGSLPPGGSMAAVFADEATVAAVLAPYADRVSIAAVNGPTQTVISGEATAVVHILAALKKERVRARSLVVSHAFHSHLMEPMLDEFAEIAATITYHPPQIPLISNVTGQLAPPDMVTTPRYWRDHVRAAVRFAPAVQALYEMGVGVCLEIGPQPHLTGMVRRIPATSGREPLLLSSLQQGQGDWATLLPSWGALWTTGGL